MFLLPNILREHFPCIYTTSMVQKGCQSFVSHQNSGYFNLTVDSLIIITELLDTCKPPYKMILNRNIVYHIIKPLHYGHFIDMLILIVRLCSFPQLLPLIPWGHMEILTVYFFSWNYIPPHSITLCMEQLDNSGTNVLVQKHRGSHQSSFQCIGLTQCFHQTFLRLLWHQRKFYEEHSPCRTFWQWEHLTSLWDKHLLVIQYRYLWYIS